MIKYKKYKIGLQIVRTGSNKLLEESVKSKIVKIINNQYPLFVEVRTNTTHDMRKTKRPDLNRN